MSAQTHAVRSQRLELKLRGRTDAIAVQEEARAAFVGEGMEAIEEVFDTLGPADATVRFERVEIDLGVLARADLGPAMAARIRERLRDALAAGLSSEGNGMSPGAVRIVSGAAAEADLLCALLEHGSLPWWAAAKAQGELEALLTGMLEREPEALRSLLQALPHAKVAARLALQLSPAALRRIFEFLAPTQGRRLWRMAADWGRLERAAVTAAAPESRHGVAAATVGAPPAVEELPGTAADRMRDAAFLECCLTDAEGKVEELCARLGAGLATAWRGAASGRPSGARQRLERLAVKVLPPDSPVRQWLQRQAAGRPAAERAAAPTVMASGRDMSGAGVQARAAPRAADVQFAYTVPPEAPAEPEFRQPSDLAPVGIGQVDAAMAVPTPFLAGGADSDPDFALQFTETAGIVLLWPFLPGFFEKLGLTREHRFLPGGARERAVLLLHCLATGECESPEPGLILDKILCGLPAEVPVLREIRLQAEEELECANLLASVVGHWKALKGTSAEGLRASFMRRAGRLSRGEHGWQLLVQRSGYDVLLERLPWAIGLVRLPWMAQTLTVEW